MSSRLPPLNALRVFEVASRRMSFSKAADELCVTNAAVSHQIRQLEEHLGVRLFARRSNRLELTSVGEHYAPRVRDAFRALMEATDVIVDDQVSLVRVAVPPAFGAKWLVPRLYRFFQLHPNVRVEVTTDSLADPRVHDLSIDDRHPAGIDCVIERLATTTSFPVCRPGLQPLRQPRDLAAHSLLQVRASHRLAHHPSWQRWLDEIGLSQLETPRSANVDDDLAALQAAIDGQGVALGQALLVEYDIAAGRLARPFPVETSMSLSYYLIYPDGALAQPAIAALRRWLLAEANPSATTPARDAIAA